MDAFTVAGTGRRYPRDAVRVSPPRRTLVLAHGAGAGQGHPWMRARAGDLADRGVRVVTFDFPYITAGRRDARPHRHPARHMASRGRARRTRDGPRRRWPSAASRWAGAWRRCCWPSRTHLPPSGAAWRSAIPCTRPASLSSCAWRIWRQSACPCSWCRANGIPSVGRTRSGSAFGAAGARVEVVDVPRGGHGFEVRAKDSRQADVHARVADTVAGWLDTLSRAVVHRKGPLSHVHPPAACRPGRAARPRHVCAGATASRSRLRSVRDRSRRYVATPDPAYKWSVVSTRQEGTLTVTTLEMTSQTWRTADEVDRTEWKHFLTVISPDTVESDTSLLFIAGGGNDRRDSAEDRRDAGRHRVRHRRRSSPSCG